MYKSSVTFCYLRVGLFNTTCINTRTFSVIAPKDKYRSNGHRLSQNQTTTTELHRLARPPLFSTCKTNLPYLKPQIRHASFIDNYVDFLSNNAVVKGCENCLLYIHDLSGLPWWINIVLTAFILNVTLKFPLTIYAMKHEEKVRTVYEKLKVSVPDMKRECAMVAIKKRLSPEETKKLMFNIYQEKKRELFIEDNCHPAKVTVAELSKLPLLLGISIAYRNLSGNSVLSLFTETAARSPELMTEGILWFQNLAVPDTYFILPVLMGVQSLRRDFVMTSNAPQKNSNAVKYGLATCSVAFMFIATICPTCMVLYWFCNGFFANLIRIGCKSPQVKRFFKIPTRTGESQSSIKPEVKVLNKRKK